MVEFLYPFIVVLVYAILIILACLIIVAVFLLGVFTLRIIVAFIQVMVEDIREKWRKLMR